MLTHKKHCQNDVRLKATQMISVILVKKVMYILHRTMFALTVTISGPVTEPHCFIFILDLRSMLGTRAGKHMNWSKRIRSETAVHPLAIAS